MQRCPLVVASGITVSSVEFEACSPEFLHELELTTVAQDQRSATASTGPSAPRHQLSELNPAMEAELRLQIMQLRDHAIGHSAQVGELRAQVGELRAQASELRARLQEKESEIQRKALRITQLRTQLEHQDESLRATTTWRIGRFFMLPVRVVRRLFRAL